MNIYDTPPSKIFTGLGFAMFRVEIATGVTTGGCPGFVALPKRWIVERTLAWISKYHRHSKDYERNTESSKAMIHIAMTARMLKLLEKHEKSS